jgi:hypothetical protein
LSLTFSIPVFATDEAGSYGNGLSQCAGFPPCINSNDSSTSTAVASCETHWIGDPALDSEYDEAISNQHVESCSDIYACGLDTTNKTMDCYACGTQSDYNTGTAGGQNCAIAQSAQCCPPASDATKASVTTNHPAAYNELTWAKGRKATAPVSVED